MKDDQGPPQAIQEFLTNGPFQVIDTEGSDEVTLERKFGNETIRITFSVSDMNNFEAEETSFEEEEGATPETTNNAEEEEDSEASFPVRCHITIAKDETDAVLALDTTTQDGIFIIENMTMYPTRKMALESTADGDWSRRARYLGPPFSNLDEDLQILMERFLEERGINTSLALFVPDYVDYKEAREYAGWLKQVATWIDV